MTMWSLVILASILCVGFKLAGYAVPQRLLENATMVRTADLLTVALLAALVGTETVGSGQHVVIDARLPALALAGVLYWLKVPFVIVVFAAALFAALLRSLTGMP